MDIKKTLSLLMMSCSLNLTISSLQAMDLLRQMFGAKSESVESTCDTKFGPLLARQDYASLAPLLYAGLDSVDTTERFDTHRWVTSMLEKGLDPFLLYMDARTVCASSPVDHRVYAPALANLVLCIELTAVAQKVVAGFGFESTPGRGVMDLAGAFKHKFYGKYAGSALNEHILSVNPVKEIMGKVIERLRALLEDNDAIAALPLPHWVLKTTCGWALGWGITWSALTESELRSRENKSFMAALVAQTKEVLAASIEALGKIENWEDFFCVKKAEALASEGHKSDDDE